MTDELENLALKGYVEYAEAVEWFDNLPENLKGIK